MKKLRIKTVRHGMYGTRPYNIWTGIKRRCYNKKDISYFKYGKRGIVMCDKWRSSFLGFWNDMKDTYFEGATIDRIDNKKGYSKENCRWATLKEQANNKSSVKIYTFNGFTGNSSDWDKKLGLQKGSVRARLSMGWPLEKALSTKKTIGKHIFYDKERKSWRVEKSINGKNIFLGRFKTKNEANEAINSFRNY